MYKFLKKVQGGFLIISLVVASFGVRVESVGAVDSVLVSAEINTANTVDLIFSVDLNGTTVTNNDFSVTGYTLTTPDAFEVSAGVVRLTVTGAFGASDTPAVSYTGSVKDLDGNVVPNVLSLIPTNNLEVEDIGASPSPSPSGTPTPSVGVSPSPSVSVTPSVSPSPSPTPSSSPIATPSAVVLKVTQISVAKSLALANNKFEDGWQWIFDVTVPMDEASLSMRFTDWTWGVKAISAGGNMRYYSGQSSNAQNDATAIIMRQASSYSDPLFLTGDLDLAVSGRQIRVVVETKIPTGSTQGTYTNTYGIKSE